jgi:hypothetical protein
MQSGDSQIVYATLERFFFAQELLHLPVRCVRNSELGILKCEL